MRRRLVEALICAGLLCTVAPHAVGQEAKPEQKEPENTLGPWRIANTLIFAVLAGYFIIRYAPGFFNARTADIQKAIKDATGLKLEADFRYSEADRKLASLAEEIKRMQEQYGRELDREHERMRHETQVEIARLQQNVENEIAAWRIEGMRRVKREIAQEAVKRAEQRLRERVGNAEPENLVRDFIHVVEQGAR